MSVRAQLSSLTCACFLIACTGDPNCPVGTQRIGNQCRPRASPSDVSSINRTTDAGPDAHLAPDGAPCVVRDEVCNSRDDDCDDAIDEGLLTDFYLDADGDGVGQGAAMMACRPPSPSHTLQNGDCDDTCKACFPGADETACDGKDNNCDGSIDEGLGQTFYRDADDDRYGDKNVTTTACSAPSGYVADATDCDDGCATCNPAVPADTTCDSKDDDCSGKADEDATLSTYYLDCDGDKLAASTSGQRSACAAPAPVRGCSWTTTAPTAADVTDCNDGNADVRPGQRAYFTTAIAGAAAAVDFDYNCDGSEAHEKFPLCDGTPCVVGTRCVDEALPGCGRAFEPRTGAVFQLPGGSPGCFFRTQVLGTPTLGCR